MNIIAWPLKRLAVARLKAIADGTEPPPTGAELLLSTAARPVEVAFSLPSEPERVSVYGIPLRSAFDELTAESPSTFGEVALIGFRVRVFEPGEDEMSVDQQLGDMCTAVVTALLTVPLAATIRVWLTAMQQDPTVLTPGPEPSVAGAASLIFSAQAVGYA